MSRDLFLDAKLKEEEITEGMLKGFLEKFPEEIEPNYAEHIQKSFARECEYKSICPNNIPKFSMKCIFGVNECRIKTKYYDRYKNFEGHLGI